MATAAAAKDVKYTPIALSEIGLGSAFGFDRSSIGRRLLFREGDPTASLGEKNHFEDEDRVRGLIHAPSAGLLSVPPSGAWPHGGFPTAPGAWAVYKNRVFNHGGGASTATVVIRANVAGECAVAPAPGPTACQDPAKPPPVSRLKPHRYWRIDARPAYFDHSFNNPTWDICSLDFFGSTDGSGPSLLPVDKSPAGNPSGGKMIASKVGSWPSAPTCNIGNTTTWAGIHGGMNNNVQNYLGWDFGNASLSSAVSVRSVKVKQFDTQYCAKSLAVQFSDDGQCFYDAWYINASTVCPLNTSAVGGHGGVATSPPAVEPRPTPLVPGGHGASPLCRQFPVNMIIINFLYTHAVPVVRLLTGNVPQICRGHLAQSYLHARWASLRWCWRWHAHTGDGCDGERETCHRRRHVSG